MVLGRTGRRILRDVRFEHIGLDENPDLPLAALDFVAAVDDADIDAG